MEIDAKTLYEVTYAQLITTQRELLEIRALYIDTKKELDSLKSDK